MRFTVLSRSCQESSHTKVTGGAGLLSKVCSCSDRRSTQL